MAKTEMSDEPERGYGYEPWDDADGARETAARFFGYLSWQDAVAGGGTHGAKVSSKLAETLREFAANATDRVFDAELRTDAARDMVSALQSAIDEQLGPENKRLRGALERLERASAAVYRGGARTGPQWTPLAAALAHARGALGGDHSKLSEDAGWQDVAESAHRRINEMTLERRRLVHSERVARMIEAADIAPIIKDRLITELMAMLA